MNYVLWFVNVCFRFETDNVKGEVEDETNQQQQMMLKNEAGWMLDYSFQQACTSSKPYMIAT